jgi:hypothetical protein
MTSETAAMSRFLNVFLLVCAVNAFEEGGRIR